MKLNDLSITFHTGKIKECVDFYVRYYDVKITFDCEWYVTLQFQSEVNPFIFLSFMKPEYGSAGTIFKGGLTLNLNVADVDAEYARLKSAGIAFCDEIADHEWGDRSFSVKDPIGNVLCVLFTP